jgi:translation initiation factor 3 subunit G
VRKVRLVKKTFKTNHTVAEHKKWKKFGSARGTGHLADSITMLGDEVKLKLGVNPNPDSDRPLSFDEQVKKMQKVTCRTCKGDHWTSKCPYKDTLEPLGDTIDEIKQSTADSDKQSDSAPKSGRYVPPSLRGKVGGASSAPSTATPSFRREQDANTLRVTNLSDDTRDSDLHDLFSRFGRVQRVFVAHDRDTGRCKGFAFVSFYDRFEAQRALEKLDGHGFDSLILKVEWAAKKD